jgi:hypothetical protein
MIRDATAVGPTMMVRARVSVHALVSPTPPR